MSIENLNQKKIILASKSPRRQYLLKELGLIFEIKTKDVDESFPDYLQAEQIPLYLSQKKAESFEENLTDKTIIIAADTIVWIDDAVLNKPVDEEDAFRMLKKLSGKTHQVYTGVCLKSKNKISSFYCVSNVYFKPLTNEEIYHYIKNYQPYDKAGAYGAQESLPRGLNPCSKDEMAFLTGLNKLHLVESSIVKTKTECVLIKKIEGSYFNVMGLPVKELYENLLAY